MIKYQGLKTNWIKVQKSGIRGIKDHGSRMKVQGSRIKHHWQIDICNPILYIPQWLFPCFGNPICMWTQLHTGQIVLASIFLPNIGSPNYRLLFGIHQFSFRWHGKCLHKLIHLGGILRAKDLQSQLIFHCTNIHCRHRKCQMFDLRQHTQLNTLYLHQQNI